MNIANLTPDTTFEIARKLSGKDLIKLCNSSTNITIKCKSHKFYSIWKNNILKDFGIKYNETDGFLEYKRLLYLHSKNHWIINFIDCGDPSDSYTVLFQTYEDCINYIVKFSEDHTLGLKYKYIENKLLQTNTIELLVYNIYVEEISFTIPRTSYKNVYDKSVKKMVKMLVEDTEDEEEIIEQKIDEIDEIFSMLSYQNIENKITKEDIKDTIIGIYDDMFSNKKIKMIVNFIYDQLYDHNLYAENY